MFPNCASQCSGTLQGVSTGIVGHMLAKPLSRTSTRDYRAETLLYLGRAAGNAPTLSNLNSWKHATDFEAFSFQVQPRSAIDVNVVHVFGANCQVLN